MDRDDRLRALDGIRAVSVALVIVGHAARALGFPLHFDLGKLGVHVFFVLSGFLITTLLVKEHERTGRISLPAFYFRRTLRIFLPFYAFLLVVVALRSAGVLDLPWSDVIYAATYTMNHAHNRAWTLGHTWSLAVEEQFYLLWPAVLVVAGVRRALVVALGTMAVVPVLRVVAFRYFPGFRDGVGETFPTAADTLAVGCAFALARDRLWQWAPYRRLLGARLFFLVPVAGVLIHAQSHHALFAFLVGVGTVAASIALCLDFTLRFPDSTTVRLLTLRPLTTIGLASYSIYIWQQLFFDPKARTWWTATPAGMALLAGCVVASYRLVEKPSMRLRRWIEARRRQDAVSQRLAA